MIPDMDVQPRNFLVVGHTATTSPDFFMDDLAGSTGRLDVLVRCAAAGLMLSHGIRRDTQVLLLLLGGHAPRAIRLVGREARSLNPDERSMASIIRKALKRRVAAGESVAHPGVYVAELRFEELLPAIADKTTVVELHEDGENLNEMLRALPDDALPGVLKPGEDASPYGDVLQEFEEFEADYEVDEDELERPGDDERGKEVIILGEKAGVMPLGPTGGGDDDDDNEGEADVVEGKGDAGEEKEEKAEKPKKKKPAKKKKKKAAGECPIDPRKPITFVLGDHLDLTPTERAMLKAAGAIPASLGPLSLHADHAIIAAHNILDRRGFL